VAKKSDNEWAWVLGIGAGVWLLSRAASSELDAQGGLFGWLDKLFGAKPATHFDVMPSYREPAYQPTEIEILSPKKVTATLPKMGLAYARGFRVIFGKTIPRRTLALLLAQSAVETGNWKKGYFEYNPANITTTRPRGFYFLPDDADLPREQRHKYAPYPDAQTGAQAHILNLTRVHRPAWDMMLSETGEPEDIARSLRQTRFFEADPEPYGRALRAKFEEILRKLPPEAEPPPPAT
jgi:hypothetical protein